MKKVSTKSFGCGNVFQNETFFAFEIDVFFAEGTSAQQSIAHLLGKNE